MTKVIKYGKIKVMKAQKIFKTKIILIIFFTLVLAVSALGLISVNKVKASSSASSSTLILPKTSLEYQNLIDPVDVYSDNQITAVLQKSELLIYQDGTTTKIKNTDDTPVSSVKQVKRLNDSNLLMSTKGRLVTVNLNTMAFSPLKFSTEIDESGDFFDFNTKYFVLSYGELSIYNFNGQSVSSKLLSLPINNGTPVAINDNNEVFYLNSNHKLCRYSINGKSVELNEQTLVANPSSIIANNEYVYYLLGTKVYKTSVKGGEIIELATATTESFDLGKIGTPTSIAFKGNNLLITGDNAVQEFKITEDNKLAFTGFAIAKGKTAFNRISTSVKEVEREKDTVATLDGNKLSLITATEDFDSYRRENFKHISIDKLTSNSKLPDTFALGENSALLLYEKDKATSSLSIFDFKSETLNSEISLPVSNKITDVVYQSGKYYALSHDNSTSSKIFVASQNDLTFNLYLSADKYATDFEIDVFGNAYLYGNNNVYFVKKGASSAKTLKSISGITKLETDLNGNLFTLDNNSAIHCYLNGVWKEQPVQFSSNITTSKLLSFALDFDKKDVFMVYNNEELIVKTQALPNLAIDDIAPASFTVTSTNATQNFKAYGSIDGANVYSVTKTENGNFKFNELVKEKTDYAFVTEITKNGLKLFALVGQDDVVLINANEVVDTTPVQDNLVPQSAFITTSVSGYYFPIITAGYEYALTDIQTVRLVKEQAIYPKHKIIFLNKEYYFAEFNVGETQYKGYVPVDYTVEILSQDFKWDNYKIEKVNKTTVYQEKELSNAIKELEKNTEIRVLSIENDIANIAFSTENGWAQGYINASSLQDEPKTAIRNILIVIAVMASVCGTTTFFLLRRKK